MNKNNIIICDICQSAVAMNVWAKHIIICHNDLSEYDKCILFNKHCGECTKIPIHYAKQIFKYWFEHNIISSFESYKCNNKKLSQIKTFIKAIELYEPFTERHIDYYYNTFIKFRKNNLTNMSREYCYALFGGDQIKGEDYYNKIVLPKNPYYQHDDTFSPFSKSFVSYKKLSTAEVENKIALMNEKRIATTKCNKKLL